MYKTLSELSEEYFEGVILQDELIKKYRQRLSEVRQKHCCEEEIRITRLLRILYDQRNELIDTAYYLKNYYNRTSQNDVEKSVVRKVGII